MGDDFIAGESFGKVRTLTNDKGESVREAGPSTPIQITGLEGVPQARQSPWLAPTYGALLTGISPPFCSVAPPKCPCCKIGADLEPPPSLTLPLVPCHPRLALLQAGDLMIVGPDRAVLRDLAEARTKLSRQRSMAAFDDELMATNMAFLTGGPAKEVQWLNVVVKADVQGSAEALATALRGLKAEDEVGLVKVKVLFSGVGDISKSDVAIAGVSNAWVVGFNVAADFAAMEDARVRGLELSYYSVVYECMEEMERRLGKTLSPTPEGELVGRAEIKEVFDIGKVGKVAGCGVTEGSMLKAGTVRVMRAGRPVHEGRLRTLKSFKENVAAVESGNDCGINFFDWEEMEVGDTVECYTEA